MTNCQRCGCTKPCVCDHYTPTGQETCGKCGCTKPCACDAFTHAEASNCRTPSPAPVNNHALTA